MLKIMLLFGAVLFLSVAAVAQDSTLTFAPPSPAASPAPPALGTIIDTKWQMAIGYQYTRLYLTGKPISVQGLDTSFVRFMNAWLGVEGAVGVGFGNTGSTTNPPNIATKPVFVGGGIHAAHRTGYRLEPWVHGLVGLEHARFSETSTLGSNSGLGWQLGGGVDVHMNPHAAVRFLGDYMGTCLFSTVKANYQGFAGVVFSF